MEIHTLDDVERLTEYLKKKVEAKQPVILSVENHEGPTSSQIRAINALTRSLFRELVSNNERLSDLISATDFRNLILDLFMGEYFELMPDGSVTINKPSFKFGTTRRELSETIDYVLKYFESNYGLSASIMKDKAPFSELIEQLPQAAEKGMDARQIH